MERYQNSSDTLIHTVQYEAVISEFGYVNDNERVMMDFNCVEPKETNDRQKYEAASQRLFV